MDTNYFLGHLRGALTAWREGHESPANLLGIWRRARLQIPQEEAVLVAYLKEALDGCAGGLFEEETPIFLAYDHRAVCLIHKAHLLQDRGLPADPFWCAFQRPTPREVAVAVTNLVTAAAPRMTLCHLKGLYMRWGRFFIIEDGFVILTSACVQALVDPTPEDRKDLEALVPDLVLIHEATRGWLLAALRAGYGLGFMTHHREAYRDLADRIEAHISPSQTQPVLTGA